MSTRAREQIMGAVCLDGRPLALQKTFVLEINPVELERGEVLEVIDHNRQFCNIVIHEKEFRIPVPCCLDRVVKMKFDPNRTIRENLGPGLRPGSGG